VDELAAASRAEGAEAGPDWLLARLIERTEYLGSLAGEEQAEERRANVEELVSAAAAFASTRGGTLADFLAEAHSSPTWTGSPRTPIACCCSRRTTRRGSSSRW
jgi:hypothetical protein